MRRLFFFFTFLVLLAGTISAIDTEVKIKTLPDHEIQATATDHSSSSSSFTALDSFKGTSDEYGDASFTLSVDVSKFDLIVFVKKDGVTIINDKYTDGFPSGSPVYIELAPSWFELIPTPGTESANATANETNSSLEENSGNSTNIVEETGKTTLAEPEKSLPNFEGFSILGRTSLLPKNTLTWLIGAALISIVLFIQKHYMERVISKKFAAEMANRPRTSRKREPQEKIDAENKLKKAKEDLYDVEIKEAKEKLIEDQKELLKLRDKKKK